MIWVVLLALVLWLLVMIVMSNDIKQSRPHFKLTLDGQAHFIGYRQRYVSKEKKS